MLNSSLYLARLYFLYKSIMTLSALSSEQTIEINATFIGCLPSAYSQQKISASFLFITKIPG